MARMVAPALALLVLGALPLSAQETTTHAKVAGAWDFAFTSPQGSANWRITFEQSADTVWGSAQTDFGTLEVSEGYVEGPALHFSLMLSFNGQSFALQFSGTVRGDTTEGVIEVPGAGMPAIPFLATRVVTAPGGPVELPRRFWSRPSVPLGGIPRQR